MSKGLIFLAGLSAGLAGTGVASAQSQDLPVNVDSNQAVNACLTPAEQSQPLAEFSAAQRRRLVTCIFANSARQINPQLPVQIDALMRLERITTSGPSLIYHYRVARRRSELPPNAAELLEQGTRSNVCAQQNMVQTMGLGGIYGYRWVDSAGVQIHQIQISRC